MQKFEINLNFEHIAAHRKAWNEAGRAFGEAVDKAMKRLIHEAAAQRMSAQEVGKAAGFSTAQVKARMKAMGLNPSTGKTLLSKQAADVLASNAEIMGIEPHEIDLMSPLAYLPAGSLLKEQVSSVTDLDDTVLIRIDRETWGEHQQNGECPVSAACCGCHLDMAVEADKRFPETLYTESELRIAVDKGYTAGYADRREEKSYEPEPVIAAIVAEADEAGA